MKKVVIYAIGLIWTGGFVAGNGEEIEESGNAPDMQTYLGVQVTPIQPETASQLDLDPEMGVVVNFVEENSPAEEAGLEQYDVLLKLDDQLLIGTRQIGVLVRSKAAGDSVELTYIRKGKKDTLDLVLGEREALHGGLFAQPVGTFVGSDYGTATIQSSPSFDFAFEGLAIDREELEKKMEIIKENLKAAKTHPNFKDMPPIDIRKGDAMMLWRDDSAKIDIELKDGERHVRILDKDGNVIFSGPMNSEEDVKKVPEQFHMNLKAIEKMGSMRGRGV
ncbi:MAG: PDZ domain-containing protein [Verrucomicrobiota bacterium]